MKHRIPVRARKATLAAALLVPTAVAVAQTPTLDTVVATEQARLVSAGVATGDDLGQALDVQGDDLIAGAPHASFTWPRLGKAVVFHRAAGAWAEQALLQPADLEVGDEFGRAVAIDGDTAVVGAPSQNGVHGAAYVFVRSGSTWSQQAKLLPTAAGPTVVAFGRSVALDGDVVVVGAPSESTFGTGVGAVYVFERSGTAWTQVAKIGAIAAGTMTGLGTSCGLDAGHLVACARYGSDLRALVYRRVAGAWTLVDELVPLGSPTFADQFGWACDVDGDRVVVAAPWEDHDGWLSAGALYVFELQGGAWVQTDRLTSPRPGNAHVFGYDVALSGDLLVARTGDSGGGPSAARRMPWVLERQGTTWTARARLGLLDPHPQAEAVALAGDVVATGLPRVDAGLVLVHDAARLPEVLGPGKPNSLGCLPYVRCVGEARVTDGVPFDVIAEDVRDDAPGLLLYGYSRANLTFHGGTLYVAAPIHRALPPAVPESVGGTCPGRATRDFNARIRSGTDPALLPGQTVVVQWLLRDPADPAGFGDSLTGGLRFSVGP